MGGKGAHVDVILKPFCLVDCALQERAGEEYHHQAGIRKCQGQLPSRRAHRLAISAQGEQAQQNVVLVGVGRGILILLPPHMHTHARTQVYKCDNELCPRPDCYMSCSSNTEDVFPCRRTGCKGNFRLLRCGISPYNTSLPHMSLLTFGL